jgi:hypothetical protein
MEKMLYRPWDIFDNARSEPEKNAVGQRVVDPTASDYLSAFPIGFSLKHLRAVLAPHYTYTGSNCQRDASEMPPDAFTEVRFVSTLLSEK